MDSSLCRHIFYRKKKVSDHLKFIGWIQRHESGRWGGSGEPQVPHGRYPMRGLHSATDGNKEQMLILNPESMVEHGNKERWFSPITNIFKNVEHIIDWKLQTWQQLFLKDMKATNHFVPYNSQILAITRLLQCCTCTHRARLFMHNNTPPRKKINIPWLNQARGWTDDHCPAWMKYSRIGLLKGRRLSRSNSSIAERRRVSGCL
jgi:hypothetical protein